jgi:hypothetical protein
VADAIWLFGYALPRHPPPGRVMTMPAAVTESQSEQYEERADRARIQSWTRMRLVDSAISVPIVLVLCMGLAALLTASQTTER